MTAISNIIKIDKMSLSIGKKEILRGLECQFELGRILVLLGPNGSGKTSFLKCIKGLYKYDSGKIIREGRELDYLEDSVMVFDEATLYEELTGREHISFVYELSRSGDRIGREEIMAYVEALELGDYIDNLISTYSLGTKKKLQFLCSLVSRPRVLLMDEYISGLDPKVLYVVKRLMRDYIDKGNFLILSTHMLDMAEKFCDDVILMKEGKIVGGQVVSIKRVLSEYGSLEEYYISLMRDGE